MSEPLPETPSGIESRYGVLSRTWELELLVSGAIVFWLIQAPGQVDHLFARVEIHFSSQTYIIAMLGYMYAKAILLVLEISFLTHVAARAYWVGLIGLDSVFPNGVKWDSNSQYGPISRSLLRDRLPTLPQTIASLDNFCSVIFGFAFAMVFLLLYTTFIFLIATALAWIVSTVFPRVGLQHALMPILMILAVYPPILIALDKHAGFAPDSTPSRVIRQFMRFSIIRVLSVVGAGFLILMTNLPKRRIRPVIILVTLVTLGAVAGQAYMRRTGLSSIGQWFIPSERPASSVDYQYYEDRASDDDPRVPRIQSDVITQPYVRLVIPYYARRDNDAIKDACPGITPKQLESDEGHDPDPRATDAVLQCVAKIRDVTVDNASVRATDFRFYRDPRTGLNGFVTYIPTAALTRGAHVIAIKQTPREEDDPKSPRQPFRIWFWI